METVYTCFCIDFTIKGLEGILLNVENDCPRATFVFCSLFSKVPLIMKIVDFLKKGGDKEECSLPFAPGPPRSTPQGSPTAVWKRPCTERGGPCQGQSGCQGAGPSGQALAQSAH